MVKKQGKEGYRSFTVEGSSIGFEKGTFVSMDPGGAARKIARRLHKLIEEDVSYARFKNDSDVQFIMRETTQGNPHKVFAYQAHKKKLDTPILRKFPNDRVSTITHIYKAMALKEHQVHPTLKSKM